MRMSRVLSADAATLAARYLVEALKNLTPNKPFAKINDTHHTSLRSLAEIFNIIPKVAEKQSTNRNKERRREVGNNNTRHQLQGCKHKQ